MKKLIILSVALFLIAASALTALILLPESRSTAEITYDEDAFGEYFRNYLFPMGNDPRCKHFLSYRSDRTTHTQLCIMQDGRPWGCDFVPITSPHEYEFQSIEGITCDEYGNIYHVLNVRCPICRQYQYRPLFRCKLNSPVCDGSCLGFSVGDRVEVGG